MAEHNEVAYTTADGNDYPAHEATYEGFIHFAFVGVIHIINLTIGLTTGAVLGHWMTAAIIFLIAIIGAVHGLWTGSKTSSYIAIGLAVVLFTASSVR